MSKYSNLLGLLLFMDELWFHTKNILFDGDSKTIILQEINGPCPLIAVCNLLSLRGDIRISCDNNLISTSELMEKIGDYLVRRLEHQKNSDASKIQRLLDSLPTLKEGLNLNIIFNT